MTHPDLYADVRAFHERFGSGPGCTAGGTP